MIDISITSIFFYIFIALSILAFWVVPKKARWIILLTTSIFFYACYCWKFIPVIVLATLTAYLCALKIKSIYDLPDLAKSEAKRKSKKYVVLSIVVILIFLVLAKIGNIVINSIVAAVSKNNSNLNIISVLGISYFSFSLISYILDVYWRRDTAENNYFRLLLFSIYFPKILQGPISRHSFLSSQLEASGDFEFKKIVFGLQLFLWGLFKKLVIADRLGIYVNSVFSDISSFNGIHISIAVLFATIQLYADFSGCMDMFGGISECFGIELEKNFNKPFCSKSPSEFWRRWHITLGTWFKDYVYTPIALSRPMNKMTSFVRSKISQKAARSFMQVVPLVVVWLLTGLWHGFTLHYLIWALFWMLLIIVETLSSDMLWIRNKLKIKTESRPFRYFLYVKVFIFFMISRWITAPGNIAVTFNSLLRVFSSFGLPSIIDTTNYPTGLGLFELVFSFCLIPLLIVVEHVFRNGNLRIRFNKWHFTARTIVTLILVFSIIVFGVYGNQYIAENFVYMQF